MAGLTAFYLNNGDAPIELGIGTRPGVPWTRYDAAPGAVVVGPESYRRIFVDAGFTPVSAEEAEALAKAKASPQLELKAAEKPAPAPVPTTAGVVIGDQPKGGKRGSDRAK